MRAPTSRTRRRTTSDPVLQLLGLAARAGAIAPGTQAVRDGLRGERLQLALVARDLTETGRDKLVPYLEAGRVPYVVRYERVELGRAVGKSPLAAVGVVDSGFAERLMAMLESE